MAEMDMRDAFFDELYNIAKLDSQVILLTADMGAHSLIKFKEDLSNQYINVGVAEQNMVSIAAGLAMGGKSVFIYTIIPFVTMRCYEQIKIDLCCMNLPVTIVGVGQGFTYGSDGPTHHATSDITIMRALPEITILNPSDPIMAEAFVNLAYKNSGPTYVRIDRGSFPFIYNKKDDFSQGLAVLKDSGKLLIIATGTIVHQALKVADELKKHSILTSVVDLYRIKPLNEEILLKVIKKYEYIVTFEENCIIGGIGSAVSEILNDYKLSTPLKRIAVPDTHCFKSANREYLHKFYNLDPASVIKTVLEWLK